MRCQQDCKPIITKARSAMTLLELLVVLVILAIVATIAVQSLQPRVEAARLDQTIEVLNQVQKAALGNDAKSSSGEAIGNGFVCDIGRLPSASRGPSGISIGGNGQNVVNDNEASGLNELWDPNTLLANNYPFQFRNGPKQPIDMSDVRLPCGWQGPYLQLPIGKDKLTDAWNRQFEMEFDQGLGVTKVAWRRLDFVDADRPEIAVDLSAGLVNFSGKIDFGDVTPEKVQVFLLVPDPNHSLVELKAIIDDDESPNSFSFSSVPIGLRALRIQYDGKSFTKYFQIPRQGLVSLVQIEPAS